MSRRSKNLIARRTHFARYGGELRFWLAWVLGEVHEEVRSWFRTEATRDAALAQELDSLDAPTARAEVLLVLESSNYLAPPAPPDAVVEEETDLTDLALQESSVRTRGLASPAARSLGRSEHELLQEALAGVGSAVAFLRARYHTRLVEQAQVWLAIGPHDRSRGEDVVAELWSDLQRQRGPWPRPCGPGIPVARWLADALQVRIHQLPRRQPPPLRPLRRAMPQRGIDAFSSPPPLLSPGITSGSGFRLIPMPPPSEIPEESPRMRTPHDSVAHRVGQALFPLLEELEVTLPSRQETTLASELLQHLVGPTALNHFRELNTGLRRIRARMTLASHPTLFTALDRVLHWLVPETLHPADPPTEPQLSFRLFLRARLKEHCYRQGWVSTEEEKTSLEKAINRLSRERIGAVVSAALEELAQAEEGEGEEVDLCGALLLLREIP